MESGLLEITQQLPFYLSISSTAKTERDRERGGEGGICDAAIDMRKRLLGLVAKFAVYLVGL